MPDAPILTVTVHDEDEINKFHYKVTKKELPDDSGSSEWEKEMLPHLKETEVLNGLRSRRKCFGASYIDGIQMYRQMGKSFFFRSQKSYNKGPRNIASSKVEMMDF